MKIYCMSDIHACLASFEEALSKVTDHLGDEDTMLLLLGDYIHGGEDGRKVIDRIMQLQDNYGYEKVIALMGNHEEWVVEGSSTIDSMFGHSYDSFYDEDNNDDCYISWMSSLPRYYTEGILYLCMQVLMNVLAVCGNGKHPTIFIHPSIPLKRER